MLPLLSQITAKSFDWHSYLLFSSTSSSKQRILDLESVPHFLHLRAWLTSQDPSQSVIASCRFPTQLLAISQQIPTNRNIMMIKLHWRKRSRTLPRSSRIASSAWRWHLGVWLWLQRQVLMKEWHLSLPRLDTSIPAWPSLGDWRSRPAVPYQYRKW